jgi:ABC-type oligopeptide transport system ATPase subunit
MKEIQDQLQEILERLTRMEEKLESMHEKTKTLLEAVSKISPQPKEKTKKGLGGLKWITIKETLTKQHI